MNTSLSLTSATMSPIKTALHMTYRFMRWLLIDEPLEATTNAKVKAMVEMQLLISSLIDTAKTQTHFASIDNLIDAFIRTYSDMPDSLQVTNWLQGKRTERWTSVKLTMRRDEDFLIV